MSVMVYAIEHEGITQLLTVYPIERATDSHAMYDAIFRALPAQALLPSVPSE